MHSFLKNPNIFTNPVFLFVKNICSIFLRICIISILVFFKVSIKKSQYQDFFWGQNWIILDLKIKKILEKNKTSIPSKDNPD